jgi:hypothetical protein
MTRDDSEKAKQATPHATLIDQLLDSRVPKTEREHAAAREIQRLREAVAAEREECADICDQHSTCEGIAQKCAAAIRARGESK